VRAPCSPRSASCRRLPEALTEDALLGGRVRLKQPADGYRVAIDPVLLAAFVPARADESVLDVGAGVGAAALCLAWRVPGCRVTGIELQTPLVELARENAQLNGVADRVTFLEGDLLRPPARLPQGSFDHVMANPPYLVAEDASTSPHPVKAAATVEGEARLADWIEFCLAMAKPRGSVTLIHRADRIDAVLAGLHGRAGDIVLFPLWPAEGKEAKRVLIRARKGAAGPCRFTPGLVLHEPGGGYSAAAEAILREGKALQV
jgi:tRNA1(Val) A37 N6-methylase TrmN6